MLRINQLKLKVGHSEEQLKKKLVRELKIRPEELQKFEIRRQSIDARKKPELYYVYSIDVQVKKEKEVLKKHPKNVQKTQDVYYQMPKLEGETPKKRPVVVGSGPAGLFCAWILALAGCRPILLERGACVEERQRDVEEFWKSGILNPMSNVQFGEGGAGTFSDGKLNTLVKDTSGRNRFVLETFVRFGAPPEILYEQKPHIGTDILIRVVKNMRLAICGAGGEVRFHSQVTDIVLDETSLVGVQVNQEEELLKKHPKNVQKTQDVYYQMPKLEGETPKKRPVVVGSGPAGLFCAWILALAGCRPILLERGACVEERQRDVEEFWKSGILNPMSNVQFGEGGAGTFSDGKLNTLVKDTSGRNRFVLETFVRFGAPPEILYEQKPHIGTDILIRVVKNMRLAICGAGGEVRFHSQVTDIVLDETSLVGVQVNQEEELETDTVIFAVGHSARDTFEMLYEKNLPMQAKSFAVGVRAEHPQKMINASQYGAESVPGLPAAPYKVTAKLENGRGVYSFCMCPGGYVVNASSEEGRLAVNGMSYHARAGENANSAIIVTVTPEDYGSEHPLAGMEFQRKLEERAFRAGGGKIPVQRLEDFCKNQISTSFGNVEPQMKGAYAFGDVRGIFPQVLAESIEEGMRQFEHKITGFSDGDTLLSGVESRTSSPVKIPRDENMESEIKGIFPCGEGAGFAGGITSAAMDGMKVAEAVLKKYNKIGS